LVFASLLKVNESDLLWTLESMIAVICAYWAFILH